MSKQMSKEDSQRVQSSQATGGKDTGSGTFAARAQSAGDKNANASSTGQGEKGDQKGSDGKGNGPNLFGGKTSIFK